MRLPPVFIDPIALQIRPSQAHAGVLDIDHTNIDVQILGPLARVTVWRSFVNRQASTIQAIVGIPTTEHQDIVYGVSVRLGEAIWVARVQGRRRSEKSFSQAVLAGDRAVKLEHFEDPVKLISLATVAPAERVEVMIETVCQLANLGGRIRTLKIWCGSRSVTSDFPAPVQASDATSPSSVTTLKLVSAQTARLSGEIVRNATPTAVDLQRPIHLEIDADHVPSGSESIANGIDDDEWMAGYSFGGMPGEAMETLFGSSDIWAARTRDSRSNVLAEGRVQNSSDVDGGYFFAAHQKPLGSTARSVEGRAVRAFATALAYERLQEAGADAGMDATVMHDFIADCGWIMPEVPLTFVRSEGTQQIEASPSPRDMVLVMVKNRRRPVVYDAYSAAGSAVSRVRRRRIASRKLPD